MASQWFYAQDGQQFGPFSSPDLKALATSGQVRRETLVWKEGLADWVPAERVKGMFDSPTTAKPPGPPPVPPTTPVRPATLNRPQQRSIAWIIAGAVIVAVAVGAITFEVSRNNGTQSSTSDRTQSAGPSIVDARANFIKTAKKMGQIDCVMVQSAFSRVNSSGECAGSWALLDEDMMQATPETQAAYREWRDAIISSDALSNTKLQALLDVCKAGTPEQVSAMIQSGANVNAKSSSGETALIGAVKMNPNPAVIAALLKAGADANAAYDGCTPLSLTIAVGRGLNEHLKDRNESELVASLIKAGADVNSPDKNGVTPLILAVVFYQTPPDVITVLLKAGADVNAKDKSGKTALDYAREDNNSKAAAALVKAGAQGK